tara:strand:- start:2913 stop:4361 length:1449 start_codon:yes stop_codon:yes gene_type:complete
MGISEIQQIETVFNNVGVKQVYIKRLADNQDNEKNQIYLGSDLTITNLFPSKLRIGLASESVGKRRSSPRQRKIEAQLNFYWLHSDGKQYSAPETKIIHYFQYPEARLSGFLARCALPPDCLRRRNQDKYGNRILLLGANKEGETFGLVLNSLEDQVVDKFPTFAAMTSIPILQTFSIASRAHTPEGALTTQSTPEYLPASPSKTSGIIDTDPQVLLTAELKDLSGIWHPSITLKKQTLKPEPFKGNQGAGYTLEALLGVVRNASKGPDKYGFEIKSFSRSSGKISIMTPVPDIGEEGMLSFRDFMNEYGWPAPKKRGSQVFNGVHRYHEIQKTTNLRLDVPGYDPLDTDKNFDPSGVVIGLFDGEYKLISGWTLQKILDGWRKKHTFACYVEYQKRPYQGPGGGHDYEYLFTGKIVFGLGTSILHLLKAIAGGMVYYDPGHEIYQSGKAKQRPQWRMSVTQKGFIQTLETLYDKVYEESLV